MMNPQKEYELGAEAFLTGDAAAGAEHLRHAAFAGHPEAQNQLARIYFSQLKQRSDLADLEAAAQGGDHVALFVLAMSFIDGKKRYFHVLEQEVHFEQQAFGRYVE